MDSRINPWQALKSTAPFVLPDDKDQVNEFNKSAKSEHAIHIELLPEPYLGNPLAPVVLLGLNPGYKPDDLRHHCDPVFAKRSNDNLLHRPSDHPFYLLHPELRTAPGHRWWNRHLGELIKQVGLPTVVHGVFCVEYFPYHSRRFRRGKSILPSQQYNFDLVREAMRRNAVIIMMRSKSLWFGAGAISELQSYSRLHFLKSVQNPAISERNCPGGFQSAVFALGKIAGEPAIQD